MKKEYLNLIEKIQQRKKNNSDNKKERFLNALFDFEITFKDILKFHITGTNGKGSTVRYLSMLLTNRGLNVGCFISPYVYNFSERIKYNNENIKDDDLYKNILKVLEYEKKIDYKFSFFEIITLTAFIYFKTLKLDAIIIEVGIGGLWDVTNLLQYDFAAITNISKDHENILGKGLKKIFYQKLGILKPYTKLITTIDKKFLPKVFKRAKYLNTEYLAIDIKDIKIVTTSPYSYKYKGRYYKLSSYAEYEVYNSLLAISLYDEVFNDNEDIINKALENTVLEGRYEKYKNIILDGAHNKAGLKALFKSLKNEDVIKNSQIMFAVLEGKNIKQNLKIVKKYYKKINYVFFDDSRLIKNSKYLKNKNITFLKNDDEIKNFLKNNENKKIIVTGSIHLLGYIKKFLK